MPRSREEFDRLFRDLYQPVFLFFRNRHFSHQESEDLAQQTFLQMYKAWGSFKGASLRESWVFGIARNVWRNECRDRSRMKRKSDEVPFETPDGETAASERQSEDSGPVSPLEAALSSERDRLVREAVGELPETLRGPTLLQLDQDLKYDQIARVLQLPEKRVKSRLYQARQKIKARLAGHFGPGGY